MRIFFITILIFFFSKALAHQPKLINYSPLINNPHKVTFPEISKAYYGKLKGEPHYYIIESETKFSFYAGITIPKVNDSYTWISIEVLDLNNNILFSGDGKNYQWKSWYEPYARDWYWLGPQIGTHNHKEFKSSLKIDAGTYLIRVFNENNVGSYSLAIGDKEFFGSNIFEKILTWSPILFYIGPYMDIVHWQKFDIIAYIPHLIFLLIIFIIYISIKKLFFGKKNSY
tara:strand:+ start:332 stop:1015 length:684 start_codon:yes stop_codon:yes gene_type:complete